MSVFLGDEIGNVNSGERLEGGRERRVENVGHARLTGSIRLPSRAEQFTAKGPQSVGNREGVCRGAEEVSATSATNALYKSGAA